MGEYLSTSITSPQVVAAGGVIAGPVTAKAPEPGYYYAIVEQYTKGLVYIPGSRSFLYQATPGGPYVNSTIHFTVVHALAAEEEGLGTVEITVPNTDCYLYIFLKRISATVVAGALVVGHTYKILSLGTTDFTLIGAASNAVGVEFVATGAGAGTGIVCEFPDPDVDETVDYVVITLQSSSGISINISEITQLMIMMMVVGMMMKMTTSMMR